MSNTKSLTSIETEKLICSVFNEVYLSETGKSAPVLTIESILLDTGLDSLGYAILITRLEKEIGFDPFTLSSEAYYPQTYGELISFYFKNMPK